jgi:hypothetical protein
MKNNEKDVPTNLFYMVEGRGLETFKSRPHTRELSSRELALECVGSYRMHTFLLQTNSRQ